MFIFGSKPDRNRGWSIFNCYLYMKFGNTVFKAELPVDLHAIPYHLTEDMAITGIIRECQFPKFPFPYIETNHGWHDGYI